jgi:hypothetical protein
MGAVYFLDLWERHPAAIIAAESRSHKKPSAPAAGLII